MYQFFCFPQLSFAIFSQLDKEKNVTYVPKEYGVQYLWLFVNTIDGSKLFSHMPLLFGEAKGENIVLGVKCPYLENYHVILLWGGGRGSVKDVW